jgi:hypothetical protein
MADVSITVTGFIPSANATLIQVTAGATMTRGQTSYYDSATQTYKLCDNDVVALNAFAGFVCEDVASGQQFFLCTRDPNLAIGATLANGDTIWQSANPGGITKTFADLVSTDRVLVIGVANSTTTINFVPVLGGIK